MKKILMLFISLVSLSQICAMEKEDVLQNSISFSDKEQELFFAIGLGQIQKVKEFIKDKDLINCNFKYCGKSPLIFAIERNQSKIVKLLIDAGADVNREDLSGRLPLHWAVYHDFLIRDSQLAEILDLNNHRKKCGAPEFVDLKIRDTEKEKKVLEIIQDLINSGADVNKNDKLGQSAILLAVKAGQANILKMLIPAGADLTIEDSNGDRALTLALRNQDVEVVRVLFNARVEASAEDKKLILEWYYQAARENNKPVVRLLGQYLSIYKILSCIWH